MTEKDKILAGLVLPTHELKMEFLQDVMNEGRKQSRSNNCTIKDYWDEINELLWKHLNTGFKRFDDQLLCATCFYNVIHLSTKMDFYLYEVLQIIEQELFIRHAGIGTPKTEVAVSIMYGMFQSSFLTQIEENDSENLSKIMVAIFKLLVEMGYDYTQYTFVIFKTIKTFKKVCDTNLQQIIFNEENEIRLLNLVNHNWENPVSGIRDQIRCIFQTLISVVNNEMYTKVINEINCFYWNKAKYLMLSEIIEYANEIPKDISVKELVCGLVYSLHKPGLVSAGADMYYAILKKIKTEQKWCEIFLDSIMDILKNLSMKPIENFSNYWCLITFKAFPKLLDIILNEIENTKNNYLLFSSLCLMKQGNKLGILNINHNRQTKIIQGIEDNNPKNRMLAIDIVCVFQSKKLPQGSDYQLIIHFLYNNMNTDYTVLRLGMLGSVTYFFSQLHVLFINNVGNVQDTPIAELIQFCKDMQELITTSLSINGNYQRKITCVKLCNVFMTTLSEIHKKKRDQTRQVKNKKSLIDFLKEEKYWLLSKEEFVQTLLRLLKDPADDIRAETMKLLLKHYSCIIRDSNILNNLIENALRCMKSKFFYEINCGQTIFKLICNLLVKNNIQDAVFTSNEDIFNFAKRELVTEYKLQRSLMETIEKGVQMHSFISIIIVVLETSISNSVKLINLDDFVDELLLILKDIINQFSWDEENSTSSNFSKMNDMVQDIIIQAGYDPCDSDDESKISGLHQIVLNCLWLNVKASCELAALLIQYYTNNLGVCKKCINLIAHVLETSRHKGVIEASGAALGRAIQHLTSGREDNKIVELPMILLDRKLMEMISDTNKMSSITRRGAGLSIMVHRIVSSDMRKDKPLFHYFMKKLLKICNKIDDLPIMMDDKNVDNQIDLPKALYIHFLTRIVTDSSLASDMMYYSPELSALAFGELTNSHWQIRNAALQLYGALVPKLIGQKKPSGTDDETIATVACDELRTHSQNLWTYIMEKLHNIDQTDLLSSHSNLVPILNILANSAKRYNFSYDMYPKKWEKQLLQNVDALLGSPIFTVRRLTAKCIYNIYTFNDICDIILDFTNVTENLLNGTLMLLEILHKNYLSQYSEQFLKLQMKLENLITSGNCSYLSRAIFERLFCNDDDLNYNEIINNILEVQYNKQVPGVFLWVHNRIKQYTAKSSWKEIPAILKIILQQSDFEKYCEIISERLEDDKDIPEIILKEIAEILFVSDLRCSSIILKILYQLSLKCDLHPYVDVESLMKNFDENLYKCRYIIPLIATVLLKVTDDVQIRFTNIVSSLVDLEKADVEMRYIAILANNEMANNFFKFNDSVRINTIKTAIVLLQDVDDDLRSLSVNYFKNLTKTDATVHAYICLNKILDPEYLNTLFNEPKSAVKYLCKDIEEIIENNNKSIVDVYNPFSNDAKNIYLEPELLKTFISKIKTSDF